MRRLRRRMWIYWSLLIVLAIAIGETLSAVFHRPWWYGPWMGLVNGVAVPALVVWTGRRRAKQPGPDDPKKPV